jgi:hypothetical protein
MIQEHQLLHLLGSWQRPSTSSCLARRSAGLDDRLRQTCVVGLGSGRIFGQAKLELVRTELDLMSVVQGRVS